MEQSMEQATAMRDSDLRGGCSPFAQEQQNEVQYMPKRKRDTLSKKEKRERRRLQLEQKHQKEEEEDEGPVLPRRTPFHFDSPQSPPEQELQLRSQAQMPTEKRQTRREFKAQCALEKRQFRAKQEELKRQEELKYEKELQETLQRQQIQDQHSLLARELAHRTKQCEDEEALIWTEKTPNRPVSSKALEPELPWLSRSPFPRKPRAEKNYYVMEDGKFCLIDDRMIEDLFCPEFSKDMIERVFAESGEGKRVQNLLKKRLTSSGWKEFLQNRAEELVQESADDNVKLEGKKLLNAVMGDAQNAVPAHIRKQVMDRIRSYIETVLLHY